jgi:integrase
VRGGDIEHRNGLYVMKLTPDAGTMKSRNTRVVPLHEHIIAQGFIETVQRVGKGALFYNDTTPQRVSADPLMLTRSRADTARAHLGEWVRGLSVDDPELSPNHSWRHTFKRIADDIGMPEKMNDAITGTRKPPRAGSTGRRAWRPRRRHSRSFRATSWIE